MTDGASDVATPAPDVDPAYLAAVTDLLGVLAYGELRAFSQLAKDAELAPTLRHKSEIATLAAHELRNYAVLTERLQALAYHNVELHTGDGTLGWKPAAPYGAGLVTAGAPEVPSPLYNQLRMGGRLVIPVGDEESQKLEVILKRPAGPQVLDAGGCRFVKLIGDAGWEITE